MKRLIFVLTVIFSVVFPITAEPYRVDASTLNLREAPTTSSRLITALTEGTQIEVIEVDGDWARVSFNGQECYAAAKYLSPSEPVGSSAETKKESKWDSMLGGFRGLNLSDRFAHQAEWPFYLCVILLAIFALVQWIGDVDAYDSPGAFYTGSAAFLLLCFVELYHFIGYRGDVTWFCSPDKVGWLWTIINFILFAYFCYVQLMTYIVLTSVAHAHGERDCDNRIGFVLTIVAIVAFIISGLFFNQYAETVLIIDAIGLICWLGWMTYCNYRDSGSWLNLLLVMTLWVVGVAATLTMLFHFIVMLILVVIAAVAAYVVLGGLSASSKSSGGSSSSDEGAYSSPGLGSSEEERIFLRDSSGNEIEVEKSSWGNTYTEKGALMGRRFKEDSNGEIHEY